MSFPPLEQVQSWHFVHLLPGSRHSNSSLFPGGMALPEEVLHCHLFLSFLLSCRAELAHTEMTRRIPKCLLVTRVVQKESENSFYLNIDKYLTIPIFQKKHFTVSFLCLTLLYHLLYHSRKICYFRPRLSAEVAGYGETP